jgi:hypothetical protein
MDSTGSNSNASATDPPPAAPAAADVVVALTSYNDERSAGASARVVRDALAAGLGAAPYAVVLADVGSTDGTREAVRAAVPPDRLVEVECPSPVLPELPYHGLPGRSAALRAILQAAQRLGARACAVVDAAMELEPSSIERLIAPILNDECDYVSPYYARRVNEGAITRAIVYPAYRALYGPRLRQPAAGEFGCSAALVTHYLGQEFWEADRASAGVDLFLAVAAAAGGFRLREAPFGPRRSTRESPVDLSTALTQVVGALFSEIDRHVDVWQRVRGSTRVPLTGEEPIVAREAAPMAVEPLIESFRLGYRELREIWTWVLPPRTIVELRKLTELPPDRFRIDDRLWATVVYDFAVGWNTRAVPADHLLRSLTPLYMGWLASFIGAVGASDADAVAQRVEQGCQAFEAEKRYLIARWRWPERLR